MPIFVMRLINQVMKPYLENFVVFYNQVKKIYIYKFVVVYLDDILIFSKIKKKILKKFKICMGAF
jgi:hypothetical protein